MADFTPGMTGTREIAPEILTLLNTSFGVASRANLADQITRRQLIASNIPTTFSFAKILEIPDNVVTLLDEYEDPDSVPLAGASQSLMAEEHGLVVTRTELSDVLSGGGMSREAAQKVGNSAARFLDRQVAAALTGSTNVLTAGGTLTASGSLLTPQVMNRAYAELTKAGATKDAQGYFRAILHPDQILDLKNQIGEGGFTDIMKYADPSVFIRGEIGALCGFRIIESSAYTPTAGAGVDSYRAVFMGADALGQGVNVGPSLRVTFNDKLNRFAHFGWYYVGAMGIIAQEQVFTVRTSSSLGNNA